MSSPNTVWIESEALAGLETVRTDGTRVVFVEPGDAPEPDGQPARPKPRPPVRPQARR